MAGEQPFKLTYKALSNQLDENTFYGQPLLGQRKNSRFVKLKRDQQQYCNSSINERSRIVN